MKIVRILILAGAASSLVFGANKDMIELQRDVALLQDQVRSLNDKITSLATLLQQALDNTKQSNTSLAIMQSNFQDTLKRQQEGVAAPVAAVGTKIDQMSDDFKSVRESVLDMNSRLGRLDAKVTDLQQAINILKNPPAPPPVEPVTAVPATGGAPIGGSSVPPITSNTITPAAPPRGMQAEATYTNAYRDYVGGNYDLAMQGFTDYLKYFGTTQFAPNAQYYAGDIYYRRKEYDNAVQAFDAVLEHYQENSKTADAHLMKGRSLLALGKRDAAAREFKEVTTRYPASDAAPKARTMLKELGLSPSSSESAPRAKARARRR